MKKRALFSTGFAIALLAISASQMLAFVPIQVYSAPTPHDPVIWDGRATTWEEWAWAARFPDWFNYGEYANAGFLYSQHKYGWQATSSSQSTRFYPGVVYFLSHDIEGEPAPSVFEMFRQRNDNDWNVAEITYEDIPVKCWIFGGDDAEVDTAWIKLSDGLQESHLIPEVGGTNLLNDEEGSFIVRIFDDPATDVHWFPGDPEPGDEAWDWADWYGAFGSYGFNNSFFTTGLDTRAGYEGDNEVYEWAFYWGHPGDETHPEPDTVVLPGGVPAPPFLDSTQKHIVIIDPPKDTIVFKAPNWRVHQRKPNPLPEHDLDLFPSQDTLAELGDEREVNFFIRNMGLAMTDTYNGEVTDTRGWDITPSSFSSTLMSEAWEIRPVTVTVPEEAFLAPEQVVDTVIVTMTCTADPSVVVACSLTITVTIPGVEESRIISPESFRFSVTQPDGIADASISFNLPIESTVELVIYDAAGREVRTLVDGNTPSGSHTVTWNGLDDAGEKLPAGIYIARFEAGEFSAADKIVLVR